MVYNVVRRRSIYLSPDFAGRGEGLPILQALPDYLVLMRSLRPVGYCCLFGIAMNNIGLIFPNVFYYCR
jgi:hypothetical protein